MSDVIEATAVSTASARVRPSRSKAAIAAREAAKLETQPAANQYTQFSIENEIIGEQILRVEPVTTNSSEEVIEAVEAAEVVVKTKAQLALELFKTEKFSTNAEFVQILMDKLGMSKFGARTYAYNVRNAVGAEAAKKAPKATKVAGKKAPSAPKAAKKAVEKDSDADGEGVAIDIDPDVEAEAKLRHAESPVKIVAWEKLTHAARAEFRKQATKIVANKRSAPVKAKVDAEDVFANAH